MSINAIIQDIGYLNGWVDKITTACSVCGVGFEVGLRKVEL